jgi:hypothetical protein
MKTVLVMVWTLTESCGINMPRDSVATSQKYMSAQGCQDAIVERMEHKPALLINIFCAEKAPE